MFGLLLLAVSVCGILGQQEPRIDVDAQDVDKFPEHFTGLSVQTNDPPNAKKYWKRNGKVIDINYQPPFQSINSERLFVSKPDLRYQGYYQFFMETPAGKISGRNVSVLFTYVGTFAKKTSMQTQDVTVGQATFLKCPEESEPGRNFIYKWGKTSGVGGTKFVNPSPYHIVLDDGTLFFSHLLKKDVNYINEFNVNCGMEASVGPDNRFTWSQVVKMNAIAENNTAFGPEMVTKLPRKTFKETDTISMKCAAAGRPLPNYSWTMTDDYGKTKRVIDGDNGVLFEDGDPRILVIKSATRHNSGTYNCTATISANGTKTSTSVIGHLKYEELPSWKEPRIKSVAPSIYANHSWECLATGHPEPSYAWFVNATKITSKPGEYEITGGKILFPRLQKENSGMYKCVAQNSLDNIYQTAFLNVQAKKPTFKTNVGTKTLFLNNDGIIMCTADAAPEAVNTWQKDGIEIDLSLDKYELTRDGGLLIRSVSKKDIGNYSCMATNIYGKDVKKIGVQVVGEITFLQRPISANVTVKANVILKCEAKGEKELKTTIKYKWIFDGVILKDGNSSSKLWVENQHMLYIVQAKVSDSGVYECIAYIEKPSYAEKRTSARVIVRGPPDAPTNVLIKDGCDSFSAKLTWKISRKSFDPITHFIIKAVTSYHGSEWHTVAGNISGSLNEFEVTGLSPYAKYRFLLIAVNGIGPSEPSAPTNFEHCQTPESVPVICPKITVVAGRANQLSVTWKKIMLIDQNGKNFKYQLKYRKVMTPEAEWSEKNFSAIMTNFSIPDAGYYEEWEMELRGVNHAGLGPICRERQYSGQNAPTSAPEGFKITSKSFDYVVLEWKPITVTLGSIDGYKLRFWKDDEAGRRRRRWNGVNSCDGKTCVDIPDGLRSTYRLTGLTAATGYTMELNGYNSGGHGPASSLKVATTDGTPSEPTNLNCTVYGKYIRVQWDLPEAPNGDVIGYRVFISGSYDKSVELSGDQTSWVFKDLDPEKRHEVYVEAKTKKGFGDKADIVIFTQAVMVPAKPAVPFAIGTGEDAVNVTFREGFPVQGFPERFYTVYRPKDSDDELVQSDQQVLDIENPAPFIVISGLDVNTEYEFATVAVNYHGESIMSDFNATYPGALTPQAQSSPLYKRDWFIAIVVIICLLLLILLLALLITRKHGERYPVGKREKKRAGILDDVEEAEPEAYPMKPARNAGNGHNRNNSTGSFTHKDPDRDSLDDYGEDKFGEDAGSLIGEYNDDRNAGASGGGPEFV